MNLTTNGPTPMPINHQTKSRKLNRRTFLNQAVSSLLCCSTFAVTAQPLEYKSFGAYPFKLGVASGDPLSDGFVIWTRLAPIPFNDQALPPQPIIVEWEIARDPKMKKVLRRGYSLAEPNFAHSVHTEINGLEPATEYYYRFYCGGEYSPTGRSRTLPLPGTALENLKFAQVCCQSIHDGYFSAYRDICEHDLDFILHLGDYTYNSDYVADMRRIPVSEANSLSDYRALHARYKLDPLLQQAHQHTPWLMVLDDHEVSNDHGGDYSEASLDTETNLQRKIAGYQAYYEHMPMRLRAGPRNGTFRFHQRTVFGDLLQLDLLDFRQYRDNPACL
ncbi:MAG: alkaline phosphatase D family protein, partial [Photobacterium frigidiphilum]|uniref:alkaline phosphatase D family protein n=1 Tax=Photobacterium frigidiphilum TaxID=264736 RepID=UPI003001BB2B